MTRKSRGHLIIPIKSGCFQVCLFSRCARMAHLMYAQLCLQDKQNQHN